MILYDAIGPGYDLVQDLGRQGLAARHGLVEWGTEIEITQGVEMGRPSLLVARADGGGGLIDAVEVGGCAVVVARGEFRL